MTILCLSLFLSATTTPSFAGLPVGAYQSSACACPMVAIVDPCLDCADNGEHLIDFDDPDDPCGGPELMTAMVSGWRSVGKLSPSDPHRSIPSVYLQILVPPKISV